MMAAAVEGIKRETEAKDEWEVVSDDVSTVNLETANVRELDEPAPEQQVSNPIGELQELCVRKSWALPEYTEEYKIGPPHLTTFAIKCSVNGCSVSKSGCSKKMAKKASAAAMLAKLKEKPPTSERCSNGLSEQRVVAVELTEIENTLNQLKLSVGEAGPEQVTAADVEKQLSDLAQKYNVSIVSRADSDIEGRSVWICELEGTVITGYGNKPQEARIDAAKGVIHHLRMKLED